ncbi:MAG TPA: hypothetical protein PKK06_05100 [Phycisphaerae bacterium]|nr:hypothetical protein [Phycisphaerae bacterium]
MITLNESIDYQYTIRNLGREIEKNRQALDAFRTEWDGLTLKEAFTSDEVSAFVPQIFSDEIIKLGLREAQARNLFPTVAQTTNNSFTQRYKYKLDRGVQILGELDEIKTSKHAMKKITFGFNKVASAALFSWERLADSPIADAVDESTFAISQFYRVENQLMWDNLCRFSQGTKATEWDNWVLGADVCSDPYGTEDEALQIMDAMESAYLDMTTALVDRFDASGLRWLFSPLVFTILWKYATWRRFDAGGQTPVQTTGNLPLPYGLPYTIIEPGYWRAGKLESEWVSTPCDIYLINCSQAAGIRERVGQRLDNFTRETIQASGSILWERIGMYTRHPKAYRRISPTQDYADQISANPTDTVNNENIILRVGADA